MSDEWVLIEPNEKQGVFMWHSMGYKVRKDTLTSICVNLLEDVGMIDPITYNHIKWAMQRAIFDYEASRNNGGERTQ